MTWLINASQLDKFRKSQKNVTILDASWHLSSDSRNPRDEFLSGHIAGARFFDFTEFNDPTSTLPNMLTRDETVIGEKLAALGVTNDHKVIFYDRSDLHTSCRALWMFKAFGHNPAQLYVLDGGFSAWEKYGGKIDNGEPRNISPKSYTVSFEANNIRSLIQMKNNLHHPSEQVVDVRHPVRYAGGKEIRAGLRSGHIPKSFCFPYFTMFESDGRWKPIEKIRRQLTGIGVDLQYPVVTMCGSGITAAILNFALDLMNQSQHALYDGSWTEWGSDQLYQGEASIDERPVETSLDT